MEKLTKDDIDKDIDKNLNEIEIKLKQPKDDEIQQKITTNSIGVSKGQYLVSGSGNPSTSYLSVGDYITTSISYLIMQNDGNLCIYRGTGPTDNQGFVWGSLNSSNKISPGIGNYYTLMQDDGNFCTYPGIDPNSNPPTPGTAIWCSRNTSLTGSFYTIIQNNGNVCTYKGTGPNDNQGAIWCTGSAFEPNGSYLVDNISNPSSYLKNEEFIASSVSYLIMQSDGNLCEYLGNRIINPPTPGKARWCSYPKQMQSLSYALMQADGNFCTYPGIDPITNPPTPGYATWCSYPKQMQSPPYYTIIQDDANICTYPGIDPITNPPGYATWCSGSNFTYPQFNMIFSSDPQLPWWDSQYRFNTNNGTVDLWADPNQTTKPKDGPFDNALIMYGYKRIGGQYYSMDQLLSYTGLQGPLLGVIVNGDLTSFGLDDLGNPQLRGYKGMLDMLDLPYYLGLGNHDYKNNLPPDGSCYLNQCSSRMVRFMWDHVSSIPGVSYDFNVSNTYYKWPSYRKDYTGSLAYSFNIDNLHIIQLHDEPNYSRSWDNWHSSKARRDYFTITSSMTWLANDLSQAQTRGDTIIVNMHNYGDGWDTTAFNNLITQYGVSAVFSGHIHRDCGLKSYIGTNNIPLFRSGSSSWGHYLAVNFNNIQNQFTVYKVNNNDDGNYIFPANPTTPGTRDAAFGTNTIWTCSYLANSSPCTGAKINPSSPVPTTIPIYHEPKTESIQVQMMQKEKEDKILNPTYPITTKINIPELKNECINIKIHVDESEPVSIPVTTMDAETYRKEVVLPFYRSLWMEIHSKAALVMLFQLDKYEYCKWIRDIPNSLICSICRNHMTEYIKNNPPENYADVFYWAWKFHNNVNLKSGKPLFDYRSAVNKYI